VRRRTRVRRALRPYCASQQSTTAIEEIGRAGGDGPKMFQLYVLSDRDATAKLIRRAETMGATALCITVDAPVLGRRERDVRNRFKLKAGLKLVNVENNQNAKNAKSADNQTKSAVDAKRAQSAIARRIGGRDASLSWDHLVWLRTVTKLPIVLKGICTYADARLATQAGVAAVWVSNHGRPSARRVRGDAGRVTRGRRGGGWEVPGDLRRGCAKGKRRFEGARVGRGFGGGRAAVRVGVGVRGRGRGWQGAGAADGGASRRDDIGGVRRREGGETAGFGAAFRGETAAL